MTSAAACWADEVLGLIVDEIYGMTEASFLVGNAHRYYPVVQGSMGLPYPGQTIALRGPDGEVPAPGETGEIAVHPSCPTLFLGYHGNPRATAERFSRGWYATGDLATCDERGYLFYVGRTDDLIISAGHRIGPGEIEEAIRRDSTVREVAVVGVPDATRGQRVKAFVQLCDGGEHTQELTERLQNLVTNRRRPPRLPTRDRVCAGVAADAHRQGAAARAARAIRLRSRAFGCRRAAASGRSAGTSGWFAAL